MKKPELNNGWLNANDGKYSSIVGLIIEGLTDNPDFASPVPALSTVDDAYKAYKEHVVTRDKVSSYNASLRAPLRVTLTGLLKLLGPWIVNKAGGDLAKLMSTNWPLADTPLPAPDPEVPTNIELFYNGNPPDLLVKCDAQTNAQFYMVRIGQVLNEWLWQETSVNTTVTVKGLPVGVKLYAQMRMQNINGPSNWSATIPFRLNEPDVTVPKFKKLKTKT